MPLPIDPERLNRAIDLAGYSTKQLCGKAEISIQYGCDIRKGRRKLTRNPGLVKKLADILGVPIDWITEPDEGSEPAA